MIQNLKGKCAEKNIPQSERREFGHTLDPDSENDETFTPCGHCGALRFRKIPLCTYPTEEIGKGFFCDNGNVKIGIENPSEATR